MSAFTDQLQQASFRGVPFAVLVSESRFGRRLAVHEYPKKDKPWAEDMGRSTRPFVIQGFLISDSAVYGGGDVLGQRDRLVAACETNGPGPLVHPSLGNLTVSIEDRGLSVTERWDLGRVFQISIICIESGDRQFPGGDTDTASASDASADDADAAAAEDFADNVTGPYEDGSGIVDMAIRTAGDWGVLVLRAASDATSVFNMLVDLPGNFGRYAAGATVGFTTLSPVPASLATVDSLIAAGTAARGVVEDAIGVLAFACTGTNPAAISSAAATVAAALLAATANPADAVRILTGLAAFFPARPTSPSISGQAEAVMQNAMGALLRRSTMTALARASAVYQPASADAASTLRGNLADLFESEIDIAGNTPDDNSFKALRAMRAAVILDLDTRGAGLPALVTFISGEPLPACVIAQKLYQDAGRTNEIIIEADPPHPAFCPVSFLVLGE